jgi:hypothetical protein
MSSLQKFHRRTQPFGPPPFGFASIGMGDATHGYWLGTAGDGSSKLIVSPYSSEVNRAWGSAGTLRGTTSTTDGLANTNTLYAFGSAAHPAAYYTKTLTLGGYNTWYQPAKDEALSMWSNKSATPFATSNSFGQSTSGYWTSTESSSTGGVGHYLPSTTYNVRVDADKNYAGFGVRAVRRSTI